jgi:hypothetical protein
MCAKGGLHGTSSEEARRTRGGRGSQGIYDRAEFLIKQQGLTQRGLTPDFGSESGVSMFLAGQRKLTLEQVRIDRSMIQGKSSCQGALGLFRR